MTKERQPLNLVINLTSFIETFGCGAVTTRELTLQDIHDAPVDSVEHVLGSMRIQNFIAAHTISFNGKPIGVVYAHRLNDDITLTSYGKVPGATTNTHGIDPAQENIMLSYNTSNDMRSDKWNIPFP